MITNKNTLDNQNYQHLLTDIQSLIDKGKYKAYKAFDNILVQTNWQIGERIVREELKQKGRAGYGKQLIFNLADDLGIKWQRLYEIIDFYKSYPIFRSVNGKLSWTHYVSLVEIKNERKRNFYEHKAILNSWSVRELKSQIKSKLFENIKPKEITEILKTKLPTVNPQTIFKNTYDFQFIKLRAGEKEKDLEDKILANTEEFLKELGNDFALVGRQVPIKIGKETHYIDLVLFHFGIPCFVLVEIKNREFKSKDTGQINEYIGYYRANKQYDYMRDTIGLIICREANHEKVIYALDGLQEKIFVAEYKVKLPSENVIKKAVKKIK